MRDRASSAPRRRSMENSTSHFTRERSTPTPFGTPPPDCMRGSSLSLRQPSTLAQPLLDDDAQMFADGPGGPTGGVADDVIEEYDRIVAAEKAHDGGSHAAADGADSIGSFNAAESLRSSIWEVGGGGGGSPDVQMQLQATTGRDSDLIGPNPKFGIDGTRRRWLSGRAVAWLMAAMCFTAGYDTAAPVPNIADAAVPANASASRGGEAWPVHAKDLTGFGVTLSDGDRCFLAAAPQFVAAAASLFVVWLTNLMGRRQTLALAAAVNFFSGIGIIASTEFAHVATAKVLAGAAVGLATGAALSYTAEAAPPTTRGAVIAWGIAFRSLGEAGAYLVDLAYATADGGLARGWGGRWVLGGVAAVSLVELVMLSCCLVESPRYLAHGGRIAASRRAYITLHGFSAIDVQEEYYGLLRVVEAVDVAQPFPPRPTEQHHRQLMTSHAALWRTPHLRRGVALAGGLVVASLLCSTRVAAAVAARLYLPAAGVGGEDVARMDHTTISQYQYYPAAACAAVRTLGSIAAAVCLVDVYGRRWMFLGSLAVCVLALLTVGVGTAVAAGVGGGVGDAVPGAATALAGVGLYALAHGAGVACVPWIVASEALPFHARTVGHAQIACVYWLLDGVAAVVLPLLPELPCLRNTDAPAPGGGAFTALPASAVWFALAAIAVCVFGLGLRYFPDTPAGPLEHIGRVFDVPLAAAVKRRLPATPPPL